MLKPPTRKMFLNNTCNVQKLSLPFLLERMGFLCFLQYLVLTTGGKQGECLTLNIAHVHYLSQHHQTRTQQRLRNRF